MSSVSPVPWGVGLPPPATRTSLTANCRRVRIDFREGSGP